MIRTECWRAPKLDRNQGLRLVRIRVRFRLDINPRNALKRCSRFRPHAPFQVPAMDYSQFFSAALNRLHDERRYRVFADLERIAGRFPHAVWHSPKGARNVVIWCSNDYLGMGQHPKVVGAMVETATRVGTGAGGTRNIAGTHHPLVQLEQELADLHGKEAALLFTSGYVSNQTGIATIAKLIPELPDPVGRAQPQFDDRRHPPVRLRAPGVPPQRHGASGGIAARRGAGPAEADRLREPVFDGRRYRAAGEDLRSRRALRRDDLCRRGSRGRHVRPARRRHRRARRRHAPHRYSGRHARQGVRLPRRLYRRQAPTSSTPCAPTRPASSSPPRCRRRSARPRPPRSGT